MVACRVGAVDPLAVQAANAWAEAHADHHEGREVDLGVAVGVGVVLFEVEVALVVEHAVEHEGRVAVGALDRTAVERGVVVGDEGVELEREVVEACAVGPLQHLVRHGEALPVAGRRRAVAPMAGGIEAGDAMNDAGERQSGQELSRIVELVPTDAYAQALTKFFQKKNLQMNEVDSPLPTFGLNRITHTAR